MEGRLRVDVQSFWTPWEHRVCSKCYYNNPYAVWLVKVGCFQPHRHSMCEYVRVVIDTNDMALETVRQIPMNFMSFRGPFKMCYADHKCDEFCTYAHSLFELDMWNMKKSLTKDRATSSFVSELSHHFHDSQCPSEVCQICLKNSPNAIWLAWLKCTNTEQHRVTCTVTVVIDRSQKQLIKVRPCPVEMTKLSQVKICSRNSTLCNTSCHYAHSESELLYWKWQVVKRFLFENYKNFEVLNDVYRFPDEHSGIINRALYEELTIKNYRSKFHKLVYLEEMESSRKIISECDSNNTTIRIERSEVECEFNVYLMNLGHTSMDYVLHNHSATVVMTLSGSRQYTAQIVGSPDIDRNALLLQIPNSSTLFQTYLHPGCLSCELKVAVHFEIDHQYYHHLHEGIHCVTEDTLAKLIPKKPSKENCSSLQPVTFTKQNRKYSLDRQYQLKALKQMFSCSPDAPYLLLGPFGTGKTYLLAVAVAKLMESRGNRVLVCTHLNRGADGIYKSLQEKVKGISKHAARVVGGQHDIVRLRNASVIYPDENVKRFTALVTTFGIAIKLLHFVESGELNFSHILIDEGAQCSEPEVLGALVLASRETKIVVVGDNKQVGPQSRVLSEKARNHGLGASLLERLFSHYKAQHHSSLTKTHTSTLLTNYRCHPSILMLASSLFYECALLSQSKRETHPKAPYPLVFACTSLRLDGFSNCSPENEEEAEILIAKMIDYVHTWNIQPTEPIGLLASTKQQVACLRKTWRIRKREYNLYQVQVVILPTYNIQGEEFSAVFISTVEPTNGQGAPADKVRSICNQYVFNTVITRAQSLVFVAGNPFSLLQMGSHFKINCWMEYIRRCIQCHSLIDLQKTSAHNLPKIIRDLCERVLLSESIEQAKKQKFNEDEVDIIVERYLSDLNERREFKIATNLVQSPSGDISWVEQKVAKEEDSTFVWCRLDCRDYRHAVARPVHPNSKQDTFKLTSANTMSKRKGAFHGGIVRVDMLRKCVLFDEDTEQALATTHFGVSFLCRVDPNNPILFFPLDRRYPKFANLPILTVRNKTGVICSDPKSINSSAKVSNFIPLQVAAKMLFVVKFLGWEKWRRFPLGIIVAALPQSHFPYISELVVRISNDIPQTPTCLKPQSVSIPVPEARIFTSAFTIDPEGSIDHDDALTCRLVKTVDNGSVYEVGVHITDVQKFVPKHSELDERARLIGCATYRSSDHCISCMFPEKVIQKQLSLHEGSTRNALSVTVQFTVNNEGTVEEHRDSIAFMESQVQCKLELTYEKAQELICGELKVPTDHKVTRYNSQCYCLKIQDQLEVLWKIAMYLRQKRLGKEAAYGLIIEDHKQAKYPEAHFLIQELMIWTNNQAAIKLINTFPEQTPLRVQSRPPDKELTYLKGQHGAAMATTLSLRSYVEAGQAPVEQLHVVEDTYLKITDKDSSVQSSTHFIQFEHLHPQMAVAITGLREIRKASTTDYIVSKANNEDYWHYTLQCMAYTHFTSPIRRYVDVVVQRLIHAAIHRKECPYTRKELKDICFEVKESVKRSRNYDREISRLDLANNLQEVGQKVIGFVQQITDDGEVELNFIDPLYRVLYPREKSIALRHLNASSIPPTQEKERSPDPIKLKDESSQSEPSQDSLPDSPFTWQAKICSFQGTAKNFFTNPKLHLIGSSADSHANLRYADISLFSPENDIMSVDSNLKENMMVANVHPYTHAIPVRQWMELQNMIKNGPSHFDQLLQAIASLNFVPDLDTPLSNYIRFSSQVTSPSPIWIYKLYRPIVTSEVLKVQLATSHREHLLTPTLQLIEVGPELRICIQHNRNASECFADKLVINASKRRYKSMEEYFTGWEQVLLYEAVVDSLTESELLLIKDVSLKWPKLEYQCNSLCQASYALIIPAGEKTAGVVMEVPEDFMMISHEFFHFQVGDLLCIRYDLEKDGKSLGFVLHMVIHHIDTDFETTTKGEPEKNYVYLKFVGNSSNSVSPQVAELLTSSDSEVSMSCEVQLLPLTLPFRIYRCLHDLRLDENISPLAAQIAKGTARTAITKDLQPLDTVLTPDEVCIATSIWPITKRQHGSGKKKLNKGQRSAISIAMNNDFTLIQGPPGTGKSVTGAHLAYALAKRLRREHSSLKSSKSSNSTVEVGLKPCVMYCGPSNQAVNVVLNYLIDDRVPVKDELNILRVFSKTIEQQDYPGPKRHDGVFPKFKSSETKCEANHEQYALHKMIRKANPGIAKMEKEFEILHSQKIIPSISMRRRYRRKIHDAELTVLKSGFDIILCTCNEASSHRIAKSVRPVYCIVDECAMSTEPECMVPIQRAEHVVLIGDHKQLRPVIKTKEAESKGLGTSLFERYAQKDKDHAPLQEPFMLDTQYRMHEELCKFPSNEFYDGKLKTDVSVGYRTDSETRLRIWPQGPKKPYVFVNVKGEESESHTGRKGKARVGLESKFNRDEAEKIADIAHILVHRYHVKQDKLTALTPYSAQKEEIKKWLQEKKLFNIQVKTITESQGSESGIVLLSTVRSKPRDEISTQEKSDEKKNADIGWIRRNLGFVTDRHQICVGLTRCKYGLVIVGNKYLLSYDQTWCKLIKHYKQNNCVRDGSNWPLS